MPHILQIGAGPPLDLLELSVVLAVGEGPLRGLDGLAPVLGGPGGAEAEGEGPRGGEEEEEEGEGKLGRHFFGRGGDVRVGG